MNNYDFSFLKYTKNPVFGDTYQKQDKLNMVNDEGSKQAKNKKQKFDIEKKF